MSMGDPHVHMSNPCAYGRVNGVTSASLSLLHRCSIRFSIKLFNLVLSPIDVSFPWFGIYTTDVANPRQSSPILSNPRHRSVALSVRDAHRGRGIDAEPRSKGREGQLGLGRAHGA